MGSGRWDPSQWQGYAQATTHGRTQSQIFSSSSMKAEYDPKLIKVRESRDSADNPNSTPIIVGCDVTGSMGITAETIMRKGLDVLLTEIYKRKPVDDPHAMVMAIGDPYCDGAPLQCTEFEADIRVAKQVKELWLEGGGGGNGGEGYLGAHLFAGMKTVTDSFEKRGKKGYLFTVGDEANHVSVTRDQMRAYGLTIERDMTDRECLAVAARTWEVFHIVTPTSSTHYQNAIAKWEALLPGRTIVLENVDMLAEVVVSAIQINEGANKTAVVGSWSGATSLVVANAVRSLAAGSAGTGVQRF
jgi:hypothetical protein